MPGFEPTSRLEIIKKNTLLTNLSREYYRPNDSVKHENFFTDFPF